MVDLKFWKKDKEDKYDNFEGFGGRGAFGPANGPGMSSNPESFPQSNTSLGLPGAPTQMSYGSSGNDVEIIKKDIEILNSKMDSLKSFLEAINQKLMNIENKLNNEGGSSESSWHY